MAREDVNIKVSANVAEAIRLWKAMEEGPDGMARELDSLGAKGRKAASGMAGEFDKLIGKWASVAGAIQAAKAILDAYIKSQKEALDRTGESTVTVDTRSRELFVQSGGTRSLESLRKAVLDIAINRSVGPEKAFDSAKQLVSSGFSIGEVLEGGSTDAFLQVLAATNQSRPDVNAEELAKALALFMTSTGAPLNRKGIMGAGSALQSLFQSTNIQADQLAMFAPEAGTISKFSGLQGPEQLAILSQFLNVADIAKSKTSFRAGVVSLATAGATPDKAAALKQIGLTPEDVDFQGEDFFEVQKRLTGALGAVTGDVRNQVMKRLLTQEGLLFGTTLLTPEGMAQTAQYQGMAKSRGAFDQAVAVSEGSIEAKRAAAKSFETQQHFDENFIDPQTARTLLLSWIKAQDGGAISRMAAESAFDLGMTTFQNADIATHAAVRAAGGSRETAADIVNMARASQVEVKVTLQDQNQVAIPHKADVHEVGKNTSKGGR